MKVDFLISVGSPKEFPNYGLPEVAFVGRSNVGKSSLINTLVGQRRVAFVSKTPGRTQTINYYRVGERMVFVDLPGYGYAKVPLSVKAQWQELAEGYLIQRAVPKLILILFDIRREPGEQETQLIGWLNHYRLRHQIVLTKADKIKKNQRFPQVKRIASALDLRPEAITVFSALNGEGRDVVWELINTFRDPLVSRD